MIARELFDRLGPLIAPALRETFDRLDLCILATRVAIDTAAYFGIEAQPLPVGVVVYNAAFAAHVANQFEGITDMNPATWGDSSWSVGVRPSAPRADGRWNGHLIAVADGCFADYSIQQAERPQHDIYTGPALVGPYRGQEMWSAVHPGTGTVIEYRRFEDDSWRGAPDWRDAARRRPIVGKLIRALRDQHLHRQG